MPFLESLPSALLIHLHEDWRIWARRDQLPSAKDFRLWLLMGGRGAGKTRAGAEWVSEKVRYAKHPLRIALLGPSYHEARMVMAEGVSGILAVSRHDFMPRYEISKHQITWPDGSIAQILSAEEPDSLRGPQFHYAWADELAKWKRPREAWDMLQFALRLGRKPQAVVTTTPRPLPFLKELMEMETTVTSRARTSMNRAHLAPAFLESVARAYGGTRLGRQELDGELLLEREEALFPRGLIERCRERGAPALTRIVVAVDPPASSGAGANACGIVAAGVDAQGIAHVLQDASVEAKSPSAWAARALELYHALHADALIAEANQGGEMVRAVMTGVDARVPVRLVHATRGKQARAEPVAALYEQGRVRHAKPMPELEDELCEFEAIVASSGRSPDRADALVWAITELMLKRAPAPRARVM